MLKTNLITPLRQRLQNCGSSLKASDMKALLDALSKLESNLNSVIEDMIPEAPKDGYKYVRANGAWVRIDASVTPIKGDFDSTDFNNDYKI